MAEGKDQLVIKHGDGWAVKGKGNVKITKIFRTQKEAMEYAKAITENQKSSMTVQSKKGSFRLREASSSKKADDKKKAAEAKAQKEAKVAAKAATKPPAKPIDKPASKTKK